MIHSVFLTFFLSILAGRGQYSSILLESLSPLLGGMNPAYNYRLSGEVDVENRVAYFSLKQIQTVVRRRYHGSKET